MSGEQAVMEDVGYVRLGGQTLQGGGVVCGCRVRRCLNSGDAEVFAALNEAGACGSSMGFRVSGNSGAAIDDEITVRDYSGGVQLGVKRAEGSERQDCDGEGEADVGERESAGVGHCCTSVLS